MTVERTGFDAQEAPQEPPESEATERARVDLLAELALMRARVDGLVGRLDQALEITRTLRGPDDQQ